MYLAPPFPCWKSKKAGHFSRQARDEHKAVLKLPLRQTPFTKRLPLYQTPCLSSHTGHPGTLIAQSSLPCSANCSYKHETLATRWQLWAKPLGNGNGLAVLALNFDGEQSVRVPINLAQFPVQWCEIMI